MVTNYAGTSQDLIQWFMTGAASDNAVQTDPTLSLGGFRSSSAARSRWFRVRQLGPQLRLDRVGGATPVGLAAMSTSGGSSAKFTPSGATAGSLVTLENGRSHIISDGDAAGYIVGNRGSSAALYGSPSLYILEAVNRGISPKSIVEAERAAGVSHYWALAASNASGFDVAEDFKAWIGTLGTQRLSGTTQLGGSGSGTLTTATSNGFADWPLSGGCRITLADNTEREVVYYSERTATALTVTARALLGTSASAGLTTDKIYPVPLYRIGLELPVAGEIQTVASITTAPTGVTWYSGVTAAAGAILADDLLANEWVGVWFHRQIPAGAVGCFGQRGKIAYSYEGSG